jgi:GWxTD domain-containing protein
MKNIRILLAMAALALSGILAADELLTLHVSSQRFLDKDKNTIVHLDYQIPYSNMWFLAQKGGYFAEVDVTVDVVQGDSVVFSQSIRDNIGISNKNDSRSGKSYLNRLSYSLNSDPYLFRITARDVNARKSGAWSFSTSSLPRDAMMSDLELCSSVRPDSSSYLGKFHRGNLLYQTEPSLIFDKNETEFLSLYFELYTAPEQREEPGILVLTVQQDSLIVFDDIRDLNLQRDSEGITLKIPLEDFPAGKYAGNLEFQIGGASVERNFEFFVTEPRQEAYFLFPAADDDYQLLKYFMATVSSAEWKNYDDNTKKRYITQAWRSLAIQGGTQPQNLIDVIRERVDYADRYFSHFSPGWTSDMGRIHIRNGKPDEVEKDTSSDETRFVRKDYQIWKYRGKVNAVYLFVDIQMNGNYKLIYVEGDDRESSNPDYLYYVGDDFDTSLLDN